MDDDAIKAALAAIEERAVIAQGEALFAGLLLGPLMGLLARSGALDRDAAQHLVDLAVSALELRRHSAPPPDQIVLDHARTRLELQFRFLKDSPAAPTADSARPFEPPSS